MAERVEARLKSLGLHGMADEWKNMARDTGRHTFSANRDLIEGLIDAECTYRMHDSVSRTLHEANLPDGFDLANFDRERVAAFFDASGLLYELKLTVNAQNAVLVGESGTGKTHLVTGLGLKAVIDQQKRVRYFAAPDLADELELEMEEGNAGLMTSDLRHIDLVIVDGLGCKPLTEHAKLLIFQLLSALNGHTSVIVTTSVEPNHWPTFFGRSSSPASFMHYRLNLTDHKVPKSWDWGEPF